MKSPITNKIRLAVLTFLVFSFSFSIAQNSLINKIPKTAIGVVTIKGGQLQSKVDFKELNKTKSSLNFEKAILKELAGSSNINSEFESFIGNLDASGVSSNKNSYLYFELTPAASVTTYLFEINDAMKFQDLVTGLFKEVSIVALELENGFSGFKIEDRDLAISWYKTIGKVSVINETNTYGNHDYYPYGEENVNQDSLDAVERQEAIVLFEDVLNMSNSAISVEESVVSQIGFNEAQAVEGDLVLWLNNASYTGMSSTAIIEEAPMMKPFFKNLEGLYDGSYSTVALNLTNEGMNGEMKSYYSPELMKYNKLMLKSSFEANIFKYLPTNPTLCFASSINPSAISTTVTELMYPLINEVPNYGPYVTDVLDIIGTLIDQEAIYDIFEGDIVIAANGSFQKEVEVTTYEYDEDYNYTPITKTETKTIPNVTLMLSTNDVETWNKFINLPTVSRMVNKEGSYYFTEKNGYAVYFAAINNLVFVSTDEELMTKYLESGYPKDKQLSADKRKLFKSYNYLYFMDDLDDEFKEVKEESVVKALSIVDFKKVEATGGTFEKNAMVANFKMEMGDGSSNIVNYLFQITDELIELDSNNAAQDAVEEEAAE